MDAVRADSESFCGLQIQGSRSPVHVPGGGRQVHHRDSVPALGHAAKGSTQDVQIGTSVSVSKVNAVRVWGGGEGGEEEREGRVGREGGGEGGREGGRREGREGGEGRKRGWEGREGGGEGKGLQNMLES